MTDPEKYDYWEKALQWESALQMQHLHDFLAAIEWWRLEPANDLIRNQPEDLIRRMVLAKTAAERLGGGIPPGQRGDRGGHVQFPAPRRPLVRSGARRIHATER